VVLAVHRGEEDKENKEENIKEEKEGKRRNRRRRILMRSRMRRGRRVMMRSRVRRRRRRRSRTRRRRRRKRRRRRRRRLYLQSPEATASTGSSMVTVRFRLSGLGWSTIWLATLTRIQSSTVQFPWSALRGVGSLCREEGIARASTSSTPHTPAILQPFIS